jgi:hypothetical protein
MAQNVNKKNEEKLKAYLAKQKKKDDAKSGSRKTGNNNPRP